MGGVKILDEKQAVQQNVGHQSLKESQDSQSITRPSQAHKSQRSGRHN